MHRNSVIISILVLNMVCLNDLAPSVINSPPIVLVCSMLIHACLDMSQFVSMAMNLIFNDLLMKAVLVVEHQLMENRW